MWQLSEAIDGNGRGLRRLRPAVIGGNVSLYNESAGPTSTLAVIGRTRAGRRSWRPARRELGGRRARASCCSASAQPNGRFPLGGSRWALERRARRGGTLVSLDPEAHRRPRRARPRPRRRGRRRRQTPLTGVHDCSAGASAWRWPRWRSTPAPVPSWAGSAASTELFCELPSRALVATTDPDGLLAGGGRGGAGGRARDRRRDAPRDRGLVDLEVVEVTGAWRQALPDALEGV